MKRISVNFRVPKQGLKGESVYSHICSKLSKTMLRKLIPLMSKFEENKNAKWVLLFLNATELGLERASRKKIVYIEHTD